MAERCSGDRHKVQDFSLHILDLAENSITAGARRIEIRIDEDSSRDLLTIEIADDGRGMSREMASRVLDPFVTTRTTRKVGLGLSLFAQAARACNGEVSIDSEPGRGTKMIGTFQASHIDRKPWGNMADTLITLIAGNPGINFYYQHRRDARAYSLDTEAIRKELGDVPVSDPRVIRLIRDDLDDGLAQLGVQ
jgi:anti-sigma regulatory factor (Ser/Thr protein kinase)